MRRSIPFLSLLAAAAVLPAGAAAKPALTLQDDKVFVHGAAPFSQDEAYSRLGTLGVRSLRMSIAWADAYQPDGTYDFTKWKTAIGNARSRGIRVRVSLAGPAPAAYTGNGKVGNVRPNARAFGDFAGAATRSLSGASGFSIWNEPNWHRLLSPARESARLYRKLYASAYASIKSVDKSKEVVFGELAPGTRPDLTIMPLRFLREVLCLDARYKRTASKACKGTLKADGVAIHPYNFRQAPNVPLPNKDAIDIATLSRTAAAMTKVRRARGLRYTRGATMPLFISEFGYFTDGERRTFSADVIARHITSSYRMASKVPSVKEFNQYLLVNPPSDSPDTFRTGLMDASGQPYAAFAALQQAVRG